MTNNSGNYDTPSRPSANMLQQQQEFSILHGEREGITDSLYGLANNHQVVYAIFIKV
jgi:hypothetical protein